MGKTKFPSSWLNTYDWVSSCSQPKYYALCVPCGSRLKIEAGSSILNNHKGTPKHKDNALKIKKQTVFGGVQGKLRIAATMLLQVLQISELQILKAEIVRCLDIVDSNVSFHAAESDDDKYATMFPRYHQKSNRVKYTLQFGIAPSTSKIILNELKN